ncbi:MAG TPA: hypothetical protein VGE89_17270 [Bryobacteraceae bacterium]
MRSTLVSALAACADPSRRFSARQFLAGLSTDEMRFIAEFLGAAVLEAGPHSGCSRAELGERIAEFQISRTHARRSGPDLEHKMIVLLEFLCHSHIRQAPMAMRASHAQLS